ncbi:MAG: TerB family tellurite resistance protein [Betaproteobacteria bacterium]|nr:TerB family tellurite resistance protein [Betaproteobacteria bacterium]
MHIVIGVVTAVAGLIWALVALQRAGFNIASLDPFAWYRRSQWKKLYGGQPLYALSNPIDVAAVLLLGVAKCEGEISAEQKKEILHIFEQSFHLSSTDASDLLLASAHLIRNEVYISDRLPKILEPGKQHFTPALVDSLLQMMRRVSVIEGPVNDEQEKLITGTEKFFRAALRYKPDSWS